MTVRGAGDENDSEEDLSNNIKLAGGDLPDKKITEAFAKDSKEAYGIKTKWTETEYK